MRLKLSLYLSVEFMMVPGVAAEAVFLDGCNLINVIGFTQPTSHAL